MEGHKSLVDNPGVPIALGEHFRTHFQIKNWLTAPALNVLQTDIGRTGISNGLKQLEMSFESGIQITPHMGMGSPIFQAATLHFSSICESPYLQEYQAGLADSLKQLVKTYWIYDNGYLHMPDIPGLGIEVDEINIINNSVKI